MSSLRVRLLLVTLLALLPAVGLSFIMAAEQRRRATVDTQAHLRQLVRVIAHRHEQLIAGTRQLLTSLAHVPEVSRDDPAACNTLFATLLQGYPLYTNLGVLRPDGTTFCSALPVPTPINSSRFPYFQRVLATRAFAMGDFQIGLHTGKPIVILAAPVLGAAQDLRAVLFAALDLAWLTHFATAVELPAGMSLTVVDAQGTVLARHPDPHAWLGQSARDTPLVQQMRTHGGEGTMLATGLDGLPRLFAFTRLRGAPQSGDAYVSLGIPTAVVFAEANRLLRSQLLWLGLVTVLAFGITWVVGDRVILRRVQALVQATERVAAGDLSARTGVPYRLGELGHLARAFDAMAEQLARRQAAAAQADARLHAQLAQLALLNQITRAIGEHQDVSSIFQVVLGTLEAHLPLDFCCLCNYDPLAQTLTVTRVGPQSAALARELTLPDEARLAVDANGLAQCVRGQVVYEPDLRTAAYPFPQRLARGGLQALVVTPLLVEHTVFGVLIAARHRPHSFSSSECEFLRQVSEHVALAAHQAQLSRALQEAYDDLRQTQQAVMHQERLRALGQMASGIAHDINNALSPAMLYTDVLLAQEPSLSARARGLLETIARAIDDVAATVARLREVYRPHDAPQALAPLDLNTLVQQVIDLTRARWQSMPQERGIVIALQTALAPNLPAILGVDSALREALINLVFNAVDAMPEGGTLTLRTCLAESTSGAVDAPPRPAVHVEVTDTGVGMDAETQRRCLEPFFTTKGVLGTGLGLAMVYGIMQRHGADLDMMSTVGQGTTVRLRFAVPVTPVAGVPQPAGAIAVLAPLRLLVVDDDPLLLQSLRDTLLSEGHTVVTAPGGQEGIDAFRAAQAQGAPFAVVITDLGMPHVDGRHVARAVKEASPTTPVLLLTGWGQRLAADRDVPAHVDAVLAKPPKLQDLREALAHVDSRGRGLV
jgi:signal transduction histidine kinase/ActR/RegA family two-component response regulator/HAMP domain-containing protein